MAMQEYVVSHGVLKQNAILKWASVGSSFLAEVAVFRLPEPSVLIRHPHSMQARTGESRGGYNFWCLATVTITPAGVVVCNSAFR